MASSDLHNKDSGLHADDHLVDTVHSGQHKTVHVAGHAVTGQTRTEHDTTHGAEHLLAATVVPKHAEPKKVAEHAAHKPHQTKGHSHRHTDSNGHGHGHDANRRDFLMIATGAVGGVGAALTAWPLINQMNPDASVKALASIEVDVGQIAEGQAVTVKWRGNPVFIRHRTKAEIEAAKAVSLDDLTDRDARSGLVKEGEPATDENRTVKGHEEFMVMMAVCTHLGCVPVGNEGDFTAIVEGSAKTGGWFCPCHGSHYDTAGRIRKGPAPQNLPVPEYKFVSDTKIQIG